MTDSLLVRYTLDTELARDGRAALLQFCFDELRCSYHWEGDDRGEYLYMTDGDPSPVHTEDRDEAVAAAVEDESGVIGLSYRDVAATLHFSPAGETDLELPRVTVAVDDYHFKPSRDYDPAQAREFLAALYDELPVRYVYGDMYLDDSNLTRAGVREGRLEDLFWVNGFGPEMVESVGRDWLLESPAWRVEELDDGGIFVWLSPSPWTTPEYADDVAAAEEYFGFEREES